MSGAATFGIALGVIVTAFGALGLAGNLGRIADALERIANYASDHDTRARLEDERLDTLRRQIDTGADR